MNQLTVLTISALLLLSMSLDNTWESMALIVLLIDSICDTMQNPEDTNGKGKDTGD